MTIGVATTPERLVSAREFFELFKISWEPAVAGRRYRVVICEASALDGLEADLFLIYGSESHDCDRQAGISSAVPEGPLEIVWDGGAIPVYGSVATFANAASTGLRLTVAGQRLDCQYRAGHRLVRRIGYDIFRETEYLLTEGQPEAKAAIPTLELHIAVLRSLLLESNTPYVEVVSHPHGHDFVCCLTHDVDFFGVRRHKADRTLAGFLWRASIGTLLDLFRGRRSPAQAAANWAALIRLPFIYLGLAADIWHPFDEYAAVEDPSRSTFFLVPFKGRPGVGPDGRVNSVRAVPYGVGEIQDEVTAAAARGSEIATHGIDAWRDVDAGRSELGQLMTTGHATRGIRMHWLYYDKEAPKRLEAAGFDYDSTWGYNDSVGYRAGTPQVFRALGNERLLELPLAIMDSALFSGGRMGLPPEEARERCRRVSAAAKEFGGVLVINWHERSLSPERLLGQFYRQLLDDVRMAARPWFSTAHEAVDWFRWRRSLRISSSAEGRVRVSGVHSAMPASIRIHRRTSAGMTVEDVEFAGGLPLEIDIESREAIA